METYVFCQCTPMGEKMAKMFNCVRCVPIIYSGCVGATKKPCPNTNIVFKPLDGIEKEGGGGWQLNILDNAIYRSHVIVDSHLF